MKPTVCFTAKNIHYLKGGGHFWVPLNWTLGLRALGCDVIWLEPIDPSTPVEEVWALTKLLKERLAPYGLRDCVALSSITEAALDPAAVEGCLDIAAASELAGLLVNLRYDLPADQVRRFRRSALLDIDPGLLQMWIAVGRYSPAPHDLYFTIGETVGTPAARFSSFGLQWHYTPPPVYLPAWPTTVAPTSAAYTTVAHWWGEEIDFDGTPINTEKRESFLHYVDLPSRVVPPLELALTMGDVEAEDRKFLGRVWLAGPGLAPVHRDPRGIPQLRAAVARRVQLCQALLHAAAKCLGQRQNDLLSRQWQTRDRPAYRAKPIPAGCGRIVPFLRH